MTKKLIYEIIVFFVVLALCYFFSGIYSQMMILGGFLGIFITFLLFINPKLWIYTVTAVSSVFLADSGVGLSITDIMIAAIFNLGVIYWIFSKVFLEKQKIVNNLGDWFILFIYIAMLSNFFISMLNGVEITEWIGNYGLYSMTLLYFPIKYHFPEIEDYKKLLIILTITSFIQSGNHFYKYLFVNNLEEAESFRISSGAGVNQSLFSVCILAGIVFGLSEKNRLKAFYIYIFIFINTLSLLTLMSRTFWIMVLALIPVIIFTLKRKEIFKFFIISSLTISVILTIAFVYFEDNIAQVQAIYSYRFFSSTQGKKDISVETRFFEYDAAWNKVLKYPWSGNGMRAKVYTWNPIEINYVYNKYVHNGFVLFLVKLGFPLAFTFFGILLYFLIKSIILIFKTNNSKLRPFALLGFICLIVTFISNMTSSQFDAREGIIVLVFGLATISIVEGQLKQVKSL
ncbi:MAG: O-antigen ligase family protein [Candidatus Kapabacteria bacterium]|nr:O-antigen ligase family protein [Candidatus Kapabacteria bacterium]